MTLIKHENIKNSINISFTNWNTYLPYSLIIVQILYFCKYKTLLTLL